ncbi:transglutaminase family protein [Puniceicoccus vermicola]|uniref:Transglutaminase family protein n=1 Tax=Puniceicoccus vermicola TaxID=388746 RepID=A0A7X1AXX6_9BACT|nr:transglutaminase family protein [Puniceicoccus vermicola]
MRFSVSHKTFYKYAQPASESVAELRLCPMSGPCQIVQSRKLLVEPEVPVGSFEDYWGNSVEYFAIPFRHTTLKIASSSMVETSPQESVEYCEDVTVAEARQIIARSSLKAIDYRRPTRLVPVGKVLRCLNRRFISSNAYIIETALSLNEWIYKNFEYVPGATDVSTPLEKVLEMRKGVCQDFAHVMLSILRTGGIPARYVSGYIEHVDPTQPNSELVGAAASHAWVEINLPGDRWWGLDPTNNQVVGERHIKVAAGRDYHDVAPFRGTFRGVTQQNLDVAVEIKRK